MPTPIQRSEYSRIFAVEGTANPEAIRKFLGYWKAGELQANPGSVKLTYVPDNTQYGAFLTNGKVIGEPGNPTLTVQAYYGTDLSDMMRYAKAICDIDFQVHIGSCNDPTDFNGGWDKVLVLENGLFTAYKVGPLGALMPTERANVMEDGTITAERFYEVHKLTFNSVADSNIVREVKSVTVCDRVTCGICGIPSDGCQTILATTVASAGSPGYLAKVVFTTNGGGLWNDSTVNGMSATEDAVSIRCVGPNAIVLSALGLYYNALNSVLNKAGTWTKVTTGFVLPAGAPSAIFSNGSSQTWFCGAGGYIYFSADPTGGVSVQDAGSATTQDLNSIHGLDDGIHLVAVGANNAVVATNNGSSWGLVTGPAAGANLTKVFVKGAREWWVTAANGNLYYTRDAGATWVNKSFPGSGSGSATAVNFVNHSVGYLAHSTAGNVGRLLRTIDGGFSWYVLPEGTTNGAIPSNAKINAIATCGDPNIVYAGGIQPTGIDGILIRGA